MILIAALAAAGAIYLAMPPVVSVQARKPRTRAPNRVPEELLLGLVACAAAIVIAPSWWWLVLTVSMVALTAAWMWRRTVSQRRRDETATEVSHACSVLASQLRIGQIPAQALQVAAAEAELLQPAWVRHQVGGEVPAALRELANQPGADDMAELARAWQLCELTGAALEPAVQRVNASQRAVSAHRRTINAELSSAKATGRLLACLPVLGIAFGFVAGGDPIAFLTRNVFGQACLAASVALACLGLIWTEKLADAVKAGRS